MSIKLIIGCMFASKTTTLISYIDRYKIADKKCIMINHKLDNRYVKEEDKEDKGDAVITHTNIKYPAIKCNSLSEIQDKLLEYDVIGIDEIQFYDDNSIDIIEKLANIGKILIISGLNGTYDKTEFKNISKLVPLAEDIIKLKAICMNCKNDADFSLLYDKGHENEKGKKGKILIGDGQVYKAVCRKCYQFYRK